jgi:hypothetical protein
MPVPQIDEVVDRVLDGRSPGDRSIPGLTRSMLSAVTFSFTHPRRLTCRSSN